MKDFLGGICALGGIIGGAFIGFLIVSAMENNWGILFLLVATVLGGILGAQFGIWLGDNICYDSSKKTSTLVQSKTTANHYKSNNTLVQSNMYLKFKKEIERQFENSVKEVFDNTTDNNPLILGLTVQSAIAHTRKCFMEADFRATGMSKQETDTIIEEITKKMLHKYLENY